MHNKLLITTAVLLAGFAYAQAQNSGGQSGGAAQKEEPRAGQSQGRGGDAQRDQGKQGREEGQGQTQREGGKGKQTTGQGQTDRNQGKGEQKAQQGQQKEEGKSKQSTGQGQREDSKSQSGQNEKQGQGQGEQRKQTTGQGQREQGKDQREQGKGSTGQGQREQTQQNQNPQNKNQQAPGQAQGQQNRNQQGQRNEQGQQNQGNAGVQQGSAGSSSSVTLSAEQRTKIQQTVIRGGNAPRVTNVNFSVHVGTEVPQTVRVVEVHPALVEIHPEWRGHMYFVVNDDVVIVDNSRKIVAVVQTGSAGGEMRGDASGGSTQVTSFDDLSEDEIRQVQVALVRAGFDIGGQPDGKFGPKTREALISFQRQRGFQASGRIDRETLVSLNVNIRGVSGQGPTTGQGGNPSPSNNQDMGGQGAPNRNQPSNQGNQNNQNQNQQGSTEGQRNQPPSTAGQGKGAPNNDQNGPNRVEPTNQPKGKQGGSSPSQSPNNQGGDTGGQGSKSK